MKKYIVCLIALLFCEASVHALLTRPAIQRLGTRHVPVLYQIELQIDPASSSYKGHQKVTFTNHEQKSTNYLLFCLYPNDPSLTKTKKKLMGISNVRLNNSLARFEEKGPALRIFIDKALQPGDTAVADFDFQATIPEQTEKKDLFTETLDQLLGILNPTTTANDKDYGIFSSNKDIINLGLWYAALSKYDQEGWDEEAYSGIGDVSYFDPADFRVSIIAPAGYSVATTGSTIRTLPRKSGQMEHQAESTMTRDFAIEISRKYEEKVAIQHLTTIRSLFLPEHRDSGEKVLEWAVQAFSYYEQSFGPYPYRELDVVEAPLYGGAGGVEFPGLVTISSMLYREDKSVESKDVLKTMMSGNPMFQQLLEFVVAHEVAHQWWNAVVGSNSKQHPFIDEAMANYSAVLYFENFYGREAAEQQITLQMKINYQLHRLLGGKDQPVLLPAAGFKGPLEYSAIVYGKGAIYFDRLRALVGDPIFFHAMKAYYNKFWFGIAGPDDFTKILQQQTPDKSERIQALYTRWIHELHGDEDIGPGTLEAVMKTILSASPETMSKDQEDLLKQLQELLKQ